jgi:LuxR family maltose regulon positive regulatory protein
MTDSVKQKRGSTILRVHLMQAMLHQAQRQDALVLSSILQALEIAQPEGYVSPFLVEGRTLLSSLQRVPRRHVTRKFADEILLYVSNQPQTTDVSANVLSAQEINILQLLAQGYTSPEIAVQLILAVSTVRWYTKQIYRKLAVHNRTQAAIQARRLNLL